MVPYYCRTLQDKSIDSKFVKIKSQIRALLAPGICNFHQNGRRHFVFQILLEIKRLSNSYLLSNIHVFFISKRR